MAEGSVDEQNGGGQDILSAALGQSGLNFPVIEENNDINDVFAALASGGTYEDVDVLERLVPQTSTDIGFGKQQTSTNDDLEDLLDLINYDLSKEKPETKSNGRSGVICIPDDDDVMDIKTELIKEEGGSELTELLLRQRHTPQTIERTNNPLNTGLSGYFNYNGSYPGYDHGPQHKLSNLSHPWQQRNETFEQQQRSDFKLPFSNIPNFRKVAWNRKSFSG